MCPRLHLTSLSFGDRLTSIAYALLFALSKNSFTSLTSLKTSHWLLLFGSALSRIFLEQTKKYFYSPKYMMGRSLSRAYFLKNSGMFSTLYLFPCSSVPSKNTPVVLLSFSNTTFISQSLCRKGKYDIIPHIREK